VSEQDSTYSTLREHIVEHVFLGDLLRALWNKGDRDIEVLRPDFDTHGYDIVLNRGPMVRFLQLKTLSGRNRRFAIGTRLADKPGGCVVCISIKSETLELGPFYWFGGAPGEKLPGFSRYPNARRATPNAGGGKPIRKNHREVPLSHFEKVQTMVGLIARLFPGTDSIKDLERQTLGNYSALSS
jgi:hypothetical protein